MRHNLKLPDIPFIAMQSGSGGGGDAEVDNWADVRVPANGGSVSAATKAAAKTFMSSIKAAGLRSKMLRVNLFAGNEVAAAKVPLIIDKGNAVDADFTTPGSGWTYSETGAGGGLNRNIPTGNSRALGTGLVPANDFPADNDVHYSIYVITGNTETSFCMGVQDGVPNDFGQVGPSYTGVGSRCDIWNAGTPVSDPNGHGYYIGNRVSPDAALYKNGVLLQNSVTPGGVRIVTFEVIFFGLNSAGSELGTVRSSKTLAGYTLGTGLTLQNITDLNAAMQAFQTALTRNV